MNSKGMAAAFLIVAVIVFALAVVPVALIWAINTLFPAAGIPYTMTTWLAMLVISAVLSASAAK